MCTDRERIVVAESVGIWNGRDDGRCSTAIGILEPGTEITINGKGSTNYGLVYSNNSSMLPNNSYLGNYWFVNLGAR